eukprot:jgi/Psemu1/4881/gm1.4881_g
MGQEGAIIANSTKQKINTKSSTEAEVVLGVDDMSFICWARYFLMAQGQYVMETAGQISTSTPTPNENILYQDNHQAQLKKEPDYETLRKVNLKLATKTCNRNLQPKLGTCTGN